MRVSRRKAILFALGGGAALAGLRQPPVSQQPVSRTSRALGADVSMTVLGLPPAAAERALDAAFGELETVERLMSIYRPDSQLSTLNRTGRLDDAHPYFMQVLQAADEAWRLSDGAFDATVQPLWDAYSAAKANGRFPTPDELAAARAKVDWRRVEIKGRQVRLHGEGTALTFNGIAQGFAADWAVAALRWHGVEHALINTGELRAIGPKLDGRAWTVGIQHPREAEAYVSLAGLAGRSLATSGDYETTFSADFQKNHVFDPRTGDSPTELASASIVAPTAMQADALSTSAMVLGAQRTLALVSRLPQVDALLVQKNGRTLTTPGFPVLSEDA